MNLGSSAMGMRSGWSPVSLFLLLSLCQALVLFIKGFLRASVRACEFFPFGFCNPPLCSVVSSGGLSVFESCV